MTQNFENSRSLKQIDDAIPSRMLISRTPCDRYFDGRGEEQKSAQAFVTTVKSSFVQDR